MRILYLMGISWDWIFQRPQILALKLEQNYECIVLCKRVLFKPLISKKNPLPKLKIDILQIPKENLFKLFQKINEYIYINKIKKFISCDLIWITYPWMWKYIPDTYTGKIIYDCMDYHVEMISDKKKEELFIIEQDLINRADVVFASSERIRKTIPNMEKAVLLRNGFEFSSMYPIKQKLMKDLYKIGYIGTVSTWFDYDILNSTWDKAIEYYIIGPVIKENSINNSKISFVGIIEHLNLYDKIKDYDALIMPFKINNIILAVDPVKLYEYICFGKCIISVWYPEIERFSDFVYFYHDINEYIELIEKLKDEGFPPKYAENERKRFLSENTWDVRYEIVKKELGSIFDK